MRVFPALLLLLPALLLAMPASAQTRPNARKAEVDSLLAALQAAPSEEVAAPIEARIRDIWSKSGSPAATLLMTRGQRDLENNAADDAVSDYDAVLDLEPELPAAYDHRAMARTMQGDLAGAIADTEAALIREPRDFVALQGLSHIAEQRGDWKGALAAWQKSLEIDPKTTDAQKRLHILERKAFGEST